MLEYIACMWCNVILFIVNNANKSIFVIIRVVDDDYENRRRVGHHLHNMRDVRVITMTSWWARWRLKSPASPLFTQQFIRAQIKKTSKFRVTGLCAGKSPRTGEFPAQMVSNAENVSIWWRHHVTIETNQHIYLFISWIISKTLFFLNCWMVRNKSMKTVGHQNSWMACDALRTTKSKWSQNSMVWNI